MLLIIVVDRKIKIFNQIYIKSGCFYDIPLSGYLLVMMVLSNVSYEFSKSADHRGRIREGPNGFRFRLFLSLYELDAIDYPALYPLSIRRSEKVRRIIESYYQPAHPAIGFQSWAEKAVDILGEILPALDPPQLPTHFLVVGFEFQDRHKDDQEEPFFKTFLSLSNGIKSSNKCAQQIAGFLFHWGESHATFDGESFYGPQTWILDCLLAQWRLLKRD